MTINKILFNTIHPIMIYFGIGLLYSTCISNYKPNDMEMTLFEPRCRIDTIITNNTMFRYKVIAYLVDGYQNTAAHEARLDSFVCAIRDSTWDDYTECLILIYKKSKYTNNENIKKNPRDIYEYSQDNDHIYQYYWRKRTGYTKTCVKGKEYFDTVLCVSPQKVREQFG